MQKEIKSNRLDELSPSRVKHINLQLTFTLAITLMTFSFGTLLQAEPQKTKIQTIAITEIVAHPALQQAKAGLIATLKENGFEAGKNLKILEENAQGNIANANLIAKKFVGSNPDVIIPISTPSAQAVAHASKNTSIPVVFSSVSDPVAAGLVTDLNAPITHITGAMDQPSMPDTLKLIQTFVPNINTLGVLYNAGEANSVKAVAMLKKSLPPSITLREAAVTSSNLVPEAVRSLASSSQAIYIPSDNTVFSALAKVIQLARQNKIPTFTNDPDSVKLGILACHGYSQFAIGQTAGRFVVKILKGEKLANLKVMRPEKADIYVNSETAKILGLSPPKQIDGLEIKLAP